MLPNSENDIDQYRYFSKGLLDEIEQKARQFSCIGFVDTEFGDFVDGKVVVLKTDDLREAVAILYSVDLADIRWFINLDSRSANALSFSRYLENMYRAAGYKPSVYIEYVAYEGNQWIPIKRQNGFLVSSFSAEAEIYILKSLLSGPHALEVYTFLLSAARLHPGSVSDYVRHEFSWNLFAGIGQPSVFDQTANLVQFPSLKLQQFPHLIVVVNALWDRLDVDERSYLEQKINEGMDEAESLALLMSLTDIRFVDLRFDLPPYLDKKKVDLIIESTLSEDVGEKQGPIVQFQQARDWGDLPLHPLFVEQIDRLLSDHVDWTQWLHEHLNFPLLTTRDWQWFLASALVVHQSSRDQFVQVMGYSVIGPLEHEDYQSRLLKAQRIVTSAVAVSIEYYVMLHPNETMLIEQLNGLALTVFVETRLPEERQADAIYDFLKGLAIASNRIEPVEIAVEEEPGPEFESRYLDHTQCIIVSRYLKHLIFLLTRLPDSEVYLRALIDAYHELHFTGHNPSISVHNVLMDNKYQIFHRDVNFIRVARKTAKQIDMIIEENGEIVRDKIVDDIEEYIHWGYQRVVNPKWSVAQEQQAREEAYTYKAINLKRIDVLLARLHNLKLPTEWERRAQIHLRSVLLSSKQRLNELPDNDELFEHDFQLTLWSDVRGDQKVIYLGIEILVPKLITKEEARIECVDPFDEDRDLSTAAHLTIWFNPPYDAISLHSKQYSLLVDEYLALYGTFILEVSDEVLGAIEREAERFLSVSEQVMLLTRESCPVFLDAANDKFHHYVATTADQLAARIQKQIDDYLKNYALYHEGGEDFSREELIRQWWQGRKWVVDISLNEYIEAQYRQQQLSPEAFIVYVGFPDCSLMKEKALQGYSIRSASNTDSIYYWPALGFPEVNVDLPETYFNLLSFALHYPRKLDTLFKLIRQQAEASPETLKKIPPEFPVTKQVVEQAYQEQVSEAGTIDYEALYASVANRVNPDSAPLTEMQKTEVNLYIKLFDSLKPIKEVVDVLVKNQTAC